MQITFPGIFLIPLGLLFFLIGRRSHLYFLTIFFIPFTATSLINSASGSPLVAAQYFGFLLIIKEFINIVLTREIRFPSLKANQKHFKYMFAFTIVIFSTLLMPLVIDGDISVISVSLSRFYKEIPVRFSSANFHKIIPIIFGMLLTYIIAIKNSSAKMLYRSVKTYIFSVFFICLWGGFQFFCNVFNIIYPDFLFNTMTKGNQMILGTTLEGSTEIFLRISSVTQEPSHFAQIILTVLPLFLVSFVQRRVIFNSVLDRIMFSIMFFVLLLSTSSGAILGIIVGLIIFTLIAYINNICKVRNIIIISVLVLFGFVFLYNHSNTIQSYFYEILFTKMDSGSALERLYFVKTAWSYFLQYPVLGLGWGVVTSHDLLVLLLANSGIIGFFSFFAMIISIISDSMKNVKKLNKTPILKKKMMFIFLNGFIISILTYLVTCAFVEFTWYLSHFYFLMGILVAINININNSIKTKLYEY